MRKIEKSRVNLRKIKQRRAKKQTMINTGSQGKELEKQMKTRYML